LSDLTRWLPGLATLTALSACGKAVGSGRELRGHRLFLVPILVACLGLWSPPSAAAIDLTGVTDADIDGHSIAYGVGSEHPGPGGSGALSLVARELGLVEHHNAVNGSALLGGTPYTGDDWSQILSRTPRANSTPPYAREPRIALIMHGGNDIYFYGDSFGPPFAQALRTVVSRHRASAVYQETDPSVEPSFGWFPTSGSGQDLLESTTEGAPITIDIASGRVPAGGTLALGFYAVPGHGALHTIELDGASQGTLDTRGIAPSGAPIGLVYRIENLAPGAHTVTITPRSVQWATYFDYWQVEPPNPEPVVLVKQYRLPDGHPSQDWRPDRRVAELNAIQDSVAAEFGDQVITVDTDPVVNKSREVLPDEIHPSPAGHRAIAAAILDRLGYPGRLPPLPPRAGNPQGASGENPGSGEGGDPAGVAGAGASRGPMRAKITKAPETPARRKARFHFRSSRPGVSYACQLDEHGFSPCGSPMKYRRLRSGSHRFVLRATDGPTGDHQKLVHYWRVVGH
jgi:lysophospholipase L1-like esterase